MPTILKITGKKPLRGTHLISGRKNAALKLIAATLLTDQPVILDRVPKIGDVVTMIEILIEMGADISWENDRLHISTKAVNNPVIPEELGRKLRASLVLVGPLLARFGKATFPHPGGCVIGKRTIGPHLLAFQNLGVTLDFDGTIYQATSNGLKGQEIYLKEKSVTATENVMMAAVGAEGTTTILRAAEESHITNLADLLRKLGYQVSGDGTSTITIVGQPEISHQSAEIAIIPDEIEVGTFAVATAVTGGDVILQKAGTHHQLLPILSIMEDFNIQFDYNPETEDLHIKPSPHLQANTLQTNPWPGSPPDLQSPFTVLATQATGTSLIHDWMYEGRLYFVDLLQKMGANIVICDPHRALVTGPTPLYRSSSITPDLRAGAALVIAALAAEGTSIIEHPELIDRGYVKIEESLRALGADITRENYA